MSGISLRAAFLGMLMGGLAVAARAEPAKPLPIVAAENFYGDIAKQIGGANVAVTSILTNPDQDPHLFEASASVARNLSAARLVIYNGVDYDPWAGEAARRRQVGRPQDDRRRRPDRQEAGRQPAYLVRPGDHAGAREGACRRAGSVGPGPRRGLRHNLAKFEQSLQPIQAKIAALRTRLAGTPVTATEPVFGYMFDALGMTVRNAPFQMAVMNNTEPSASDVAAFENDLKTHQVKLLVYNSQASDPVAARMEKLAKASHVPVVGATETEPPGKTYQAWIMGELDAVDRALPK